MPASIEIERSTRAIMHMSDGRDIVVRIVSRPWIGECLEIQTDGAMAIMPSGTNQIHVRHAAPAPAWVESRA
jgi:hypothetical protein